jgi:membrane protein
LIGRAYRLGRDVLFRFLDHDGWAIASHVTLAILLAIFPFLIVVTAFASFVGTVDVAQETVALVFEGWPPAIAEPFAKEVARVLTGRRGDLVTIGLVLTLWVASSAVEAMRAALVRAYGVTDPRSWWLTRLQSMIFVIIGAIGLMMVAVAIVLWPTVWGVITTYAPALSAMQEVFTGLRYGATGFFLIVTLTLAHLWLPYGRRSTWRVLPGVVFTILLWLSAAVVFGIWLSNFADYASTYAGLGSIMAAIVFLNLNAMVFVLGCELNAVLADRRAARNELRGQDRAAPAVATAGGRTS